MTLETPKTLIVFDTNKLKSCLEGEVDYSKFSPQGDLKKLIKFLEEKDLKDKVLIGFPEIVINEYCHQRLKNFQADLIRLNQVIEKIKNLEVSKIDGLELPKEDFDYLKYLGDKSQKSIKESGFVLIPINKQKYSEIFERLLDKAINHHKPFPEKGDEGFKDAAIFESIKHFDKLKEFVKTIFFTENLKHFIELKEEFSKETGNSLDIESVYVELENSIRGMYRVYIEYPELIKHLQDDYFSGQLQEFLYDFHNFTTSDFKLTNFCKDVQDCKKEDLEEMELEDYLEEILDKLKRIKVEFESSGKPYIAEVIFDTTINEIIAGKFEEKEEVKVI